MSFHADRAVVYPKRFINASLAGLGVGVDLHGKMPDVVLHFKEKNWLLLVESVASHGPVSTESGTQNLPNCLQDQHGAL